MVFLLALVIGIVAGLRAMTAPAAVSWAARLGWLDLSGSWLAFLGLCRHAVDPDGARARRVRHRSAPDYAQPHRAHSVRDARHHGRRCPERRSAPQAGASRAGLSRE